MLEVTRCGVGGGGGGRNELPLLKWEKHGVGLYQMSKYGEEDE